MRFRPLASEHFASPCRICLSNRSLDSLLTSVRSLPRIISCLAQSRLTPSHLAYLSTRRLPHLSPHFTVSTDLVSPSRLAPLSIVQSSLVSLHSWSCLTRRSVLCLATLCLIDSYCLHLAALHSSLTSPLASTHRSVPPRLTESLPSTGLSQPSPSIHPDSLPSTRLAFSRTRPAVFPTRCFPCPCHASLHVTPSRFTPTHVPQSRLAIAPNHRRRPESPFSQHCHRSCLAVLAQLSASSFR